MNNPNQNDSGKEPTDQKKNSQENLPKPIKVSSVTEKEYLDALMEFIQRLRDISEKDKPKELPRHGGESTDRKTNT